MPPGIDRHGAVHPAMHRENAMGCEGMADPTGFMADLCGFSQGSSRLVIIVSAGYCGFVWSVRDAAANIRKTGGFVQYLAIAAYSLNEMKGRVGAGRTRARYATRFLQPSLLRASPETPLLRASLVAGLPLAILLALGDVSSGMSKVQFSLIYLSVYCSAKVYERL